MKYIVTRTSDWDNPHCPGAQKEMVSESGELAEVYTIEIGTLEELHKLIDTVGVSVILHEDRRYDIPRLEIYDDYRE